MKMKKFISAFAALAMSVSCFAGLAITGNAADGTTEVDYIGTSSTAETFDSYDGANWTSTGGTFSTAPSGNSCFGIMNVTEIPKPEANTAYTDGYPTFVSGNTLFGQQRNDSATQTYTMAKPVQSGRIYFDSDIAFKSSNALDGGYIALVDNNNAEVVKVSVGAHKSSNKPVVVQTTATTNNSVDVGSTFIRNAGTEYAGFHYSLTLDLDESKLGYSITYVDNNKKVQTTTVAVTDDKALSIPAGTSIKALKTLATGASQRNNSVAIDNTKFYAMTAASNLEYTVQYMTDLSDDESIVKTTEGTGAAGEAPIITTIPFEVTKEGVTTKYYYVSGADDVSLSTSGDVFKVLVREANKYTFNVVTTGLTENKTLTSSEVVEGKDYSYAFSKYLTDNNGKVTAYTDETTFGAKLTDITDDTVNYATTNSRTKTIEVPYIAYTANDGKAWFFEGEAIGVGSTGKDGYGLSGGKGRRHLDAWYGQASSKVMTIPEDGLYKITIAGISERNDDSYFMLFNGAATISDQTLQNSDNLIKNASGKYNTTVSVASDENVMLKKDTELYILANGGNLTLDYILLEKTGDIPPAAEVKSGALFQPVNPVNGEQETVSFDTLKGDDDLTTKTIAVTIYDSADTKPTMSINGGAEFTPQWTAKTDSAAGTRTFYAQFMAAEDDFDKFGTIVVKYGGNTVLSQTLVTNSDPTP